MNDVVAQLNAVVHQWISEDLDCVPEVDWSRIRQLEFQELMTKRQTLASELPGMACLKCLKFDDDVGVLSPSRSVIV